MKIRLLVATDDTDYSDHLAKILSDLYSDEISLSICSSFERANQMTEEQEYDVALIDAAFYNGADMSNITLPLYLWSEDKSNAIPEDFIMVRKYQRISTLYSDVLENYAKVAKNSMGANPKKANITAVWSPSGGVGKTTVALALAAAKASLSSSVLYLNLELFSSTSVYFDTAGKSVSALFEKIEDNESNIEIYAKRIICRDLVNNISYFCCPDYYDDMNILTVENVMSLVRACSLLSDELIIDMSNLCDKRTEYIFDIADKILLITDNTKTAQVKLDLFMKHQQLPTETEDKIRIVANKGATLQQAYKAISLPLIQTGRETEVTKALSKVFG
jgi:cellulose biosynthesis protein BcsQ